MAPNPLPNAPSTLTDTLAAAQAEAHHQLQDPYGDRLWLYVCLAPVFGVLPSLWTLMAPRDPRDRRQVAVARTALLLAALWAVGSLTCTMGSNWGGELGHSTPTLLIGTAVSSTYFLSCVWLMVCVWRRRSLRLGWISDFARMLDRDRR